MNNILICDFETFYDQDYSLTKLTPAEYILDEKFKVHGAAVKINGDPPCWLSHEQLLQFLPQVPWENVIFVNHNVNGFDGPILAWHYGFQPKQYRDTLGMSRAINGGRLRSHSLDSVSKHMGLAGKTRGSALANVKGVRDPSPEQLEALGAYACEDCENCYTIYTRLAADFPEGEYIVLDWTARMFIERTLELDTQLLEQVHADEVLRKEQILANAKIDKSLLMSNDKLAARIRELGYEPPMKTSPTTGKLTYAFAATDQDFVAMSDDEDEELAALVTARLAIKSTIVETRAARFARVSRLGPVGVPLAYSGAVQTHRLSGEHKMNWQNLGRGHPMRKGIRAPAGKKIVVADLSQIEMRMAMMICGMTAPLARLSAGEDEYSYFASKFYGRTITKKDNPLERFIFKVACLSLGYGSGALTFLRMVWVQSKRETTLTMEESEGVVTAYRQEYWGVPQTWKVLNKCLKLMVLGATPNVVPEAPVTWTSNGFILPSGLKVRYHDLRYEGDQICFTRKGVTRTIWGGHVLESLCQSLARDLMVHIIKRVLVETPWIKVVLQVHDELVGVVDDDRVEEARAYLHEIMHAPVPWWPGLPVAAEIGVGQTYGDAK